MPKFKRRMRKRPKVTKLKKAVTAIAKKVMHAQTEDKWKTTGPFTFRIAANPAAPGNQLHLMNGMTRGVDHNQRVSNRIRLKSLSIKLLAVAGNIPAGLRLTLFRDKITDLAVPVTSEIYTDLTATTFANIITAPLNPNWFPNAFHLYKDKMVVLDIYGGAANLAGVKTFNWFVPLNNVLVQYDNSNTGTVADIVKNAIFLQISSSVDDAGGDNRPIVEFTAILNYEDA